MGLGFDLHQDVHDLRRVAPGELASEPRLHRQRDELLLRAVVDVALQAAAPLVLRGDQALLRGLQLVEPHLQLLVQTDVASTRPACPARSAISFSSDGVTGSLAGLRIASAPSNSPADSTG